MFAAKGDPTKSLKYATCSLKSNNDGRFRGRLRFENVSARSLQPKMIKKNDIEMFMLLFACVVCVYVSVPLLDYILYPS